MKQKTQKVELTEKILLDKIAKNLGAKVVMGSSNVKTNMSTSNIMFGGCVARPTYISSDEEKKLDRKMHICV